MLRTLIAVFLWGASVASAAEVVVWQIGKPDRSWAEFAIAGKHSAFPERFGAKPVVFEVGKSDAARDWPFIQPGPIDSWAGSRAHPFCIRFDLPAEPKGVFTLRIELADTHGQVPPTYAVTLGGRTGQFRLPAGGGDRSLGDPQAGKPYKIEIPVPAAILRPGAERSRPVLHRQLLGPIRCRDLGLRSRGQDAGAGNPGRDGETDAVLRAPKRPGGPGCGRVGRGDRAGRRSVAAGRGGRRDDRGADPAIASVRFRLAGSRRERRARTLGGQSHGHGGRPFENRHRHGAAAAEMAHLRGPQRPHGRRLHAPPAGMCRASQPKHRRGPEDPGNLSRLPLEPGSGLAGRGVPEIAPARANREVPPRGAGRQDRRPGPVLQHPDRPLLPRGGLPLDGLRPPAERRRKGPVSQRYDQRRADARGFGAHDLGQQRHPLFLQRHQQHAGLYLHADVQQMPVLVGGPRWQPRVDDVRAGVRPRLGLGIGSERRAGAGPHRRRARRLRTAERLSVRRRLPARRRERQLPAESAAGGSGQAVERAVRVSQDHPLPQRGVLRAHREELRGQAAGLPRQCGNVLGRRRRFLGLRDHAGPQRPRNGRQRRETAGPDTADQAGDGVSHGGD